MSPHISFKESIKPCLILWLKIQIVNVCEKYIKLSAIVAVILIPVSLLQAGPDANNNSSLYTVNKWAADFHRS